MAQTNRLETDLEQPFFERAERGRAMKLTAFGEEVAAAARNIRGRVKDGGITVRDGRGGVMALNKKGSRRITVDETEYRWRIRRKPSYMQGLCWTPLTFAVEIADADQPGTTLVVTSGQPHPSNWIGIKAEPIRPADVAASIREARAQGWNPSSPGTLFMLDQSAGFIPMP